MEIRKQARDEVCQAQGCVEFHTSKLVKFKIIPHSQEVYLNIKPWTARKFLTWCPKKTMEWNYKYSFLLKTEICTQILNTKPFLADSRGQRYLSWHSFSASSSSIIISVRPIHHTPPGQIHYKPEINHIQLVTNNRIWGFIEAKKSAICVDQDGHKF